MRPTPSADAAKPLAPARDTAAATLATAVRRHRSRLGLTQEALARRAGCGLVFLYNLERGKPSLRFDKVLDVLSALGLEMVVASGTAGLRVGRSARDGKPIA